MSALGILGALGDELEKVTLSDMHLAYKDEGLLKRYRNYAEGYNGRLPDQPSTTEFTKEKQKELLKNLTTDGMPNKMADELVHVIGNFVNDPDEIEFKTNIDAPIQLARVFNTNKNALVELMVISNAELNNSY